MVMLEAGEILKRRGLLDASNWTSSAPMAPETLSTVPFNKASCRKSPRCERWANELGMDFVDLREATVDLELVKSFPQKLIYRHSLFPLSRKNGSLVLATSDPLDVYALTKPAQRPVYPSFQS